MTLVLASGQSGTGSHWLVFRRQTCPQKTEENWINKAECSSSFVSADEN